MCKLESQGGKKKNLRGEGDRKKYLKKKTAKIFPSWIKIITLQIQENQRSPSRTLNIHTDPIKSLK